MKKEASLTTQPSFSRTKWSLTLQEGLWLFIIMKLTRSTQLLPPTFAFGCCFECIFLKCEYVLNWALQLLASLDSFPITDHISLGQSEGLGLQSVDLVRTWGTVKVNHPSTTAAIANAETATSTMINVKTLSGDGSLWRSGSSRQPPYATAQHLPGELQETINASGTK